MPYQYTLSNILRARLEYLWAAVQIKENDYLAFNAIRWVFVFAGWDLARVWGVKQGLWWAQYPWDRQKVWGT